MLSIDEFGLDVEAAGIETDTLADQRDARMAGVAPGHVDQPRCAGRGAADRVDERKILCQQVVADDGRDRGVVLRREPAHGVFKFGRSKIVGRRVDEVARQRHAFDDAIEIVAIDVLRQIETDVARLGLAIAAKAVETKREGERRQPRIVRLIGEAVDAVRQMLRQAAGQKPVGRLVLAFQAEQHAAEALLTGQQKVPSGLRLKTCRIGEGARLGTKCLAHVGVACRRNEPDRNRVMSTC